MVQNPDGRGLRTVGGALMARPTLCSEPMDRQITVMVAKTQLEWIEAEAHARGWPLTEVIRSCITRGMAANPCHGNNDLDRRVAQWLLKN